MNVNDYEAHAVPVSDSEIDFLAEIFMEILRKEEQHGDNNEKV
jgi:hypothetical protein